MSIICKRKLNEEKLRRSYVKMLQEDLKNERMHCLFYQQSAAMVKGLHREEFREFFLKEAASELSHIDEFATLIVQLGGKPETDVARLPFISSDPLELCRSAQIIEREVAQNYAIRLTQTELGDNISSYLNLFYEDQLQDSQKAAFEFKLMQGHYVDSIDSTEIRLGVLSDEELTLLCES